MGKTGALAFPYALISRTADTLERMTALAIEGAKAHHVSAEMQIASDNLAVVV